MIIFFLLISQCCQLWQQENCHQNASGQVLTFIWQQISIFGFFNRVVSVLFIQETADRECKCRFMKFYIRTTETIHGGGVQAMILSQLWFLGHRKIVMQEFKGHTRSFAIVIRQPIRELLHTHCHIQHCHIQGWAGYWNLLPDQDLDVIQHKNTEYQIRISGYWMLDNFTSWTLDIQPDFRYPEK